MSGALEGLLSRIEAATGSDRELDRDISIALGVLHAGDGGRLYFIHADGTHVYGGLGDHTIIRPLTDSVDDALALVERVLPGWSWEVRKSGFGDPVQAALWNPNKSPGFGNDYRVSLKHGNAPLAILAALLRALLAKEPPTC